MRLKVDELATKAGVSVDTVRFYQTKGLLPPPEREGRSAWYSDAHVERLERIRALKEKGFTLAAIRRFADGELDRADEALVEALVSSAPEPGREGEVLTREDLARETGVPPTLLAAIEREGLLSPSGEDGAEPLYSRDDVAAVRAGLALLEAGLPLSELLALARGHDQAMKETADRAVELFLRFVRDPIRAGSDDAEAATKLVDAFHNMLDSTTDLVAHHFKRVLLGAARARLGEEDIDVDARSAEA